LSGLLHKLLKSDQFVISTQSEVDQLRRVSQFIMYNRINHSAAFIILEKILNCLWGTVLLHMVEGSS